jgi:hypothetical protein
MMQMKKFDTARLPAHLPDITNASRASTPAPALCNGERIKSFQSLSGHSSGPFV